MSKKYLDTKEGSLEQSVLGVWQAAVEEQALRETNKNDKSDDGEGLDAVQPKALKKKFKDRKDKDIDNDGDVDSSDKYLHKRRKAVSKAIEKEGLENSPNTANSQHLCAKNVVHEEWGEGECVPTMHAIPDEDGNVAWYDVMFEHGIEKGVVISELKVTRSEAHENHNKKNGKMLKAKKHHAESYEFGTDEYRKHTQKVTPGQDITDYQNFKVNSMKEALAKVWGLDEEVELDEATGKEIAAKMMKDKTMKAFAPKVAKMKSVTADDLEKMLPDYVAGGDIAKLFAGYMSNSYKKEGKTATGEKRDEIDLNPKIGEKKER